MVDMWSGEILLPGGITIKDVGLSSPNAAPAPALPRTSLRFLATVETAKIPLHLAAGPSADVWTTCEATEAWFASILLSKHVVGHAWWTLARSQSPIGILVQVPGGGEGGEGSRAPRVTEVLFYGTIVTTTAPGLLTPPCSSPEHDDAEAGQLPELRVHALPLSSQLLYRQAATSASPAPAPPINDVHGDPYFLPRQPDMLSAPDSPRRKRDIFEAATIANKKARGRGGAGVAATVARGSEFQLPTGPMKSLSFDTRTLPLAGSRPSSGNGALSRPALRPLSRSSSISSDTRPLSGKGLPDCHTKRSTLSQVAVVSRQLEEPTTETRNKEALSRVVMAAMRMHGLQQRKKTRSRRASDAPETANSQDTSAAAAGMDEEAAEDEEYKLMYHQTYKGAAFAFRKHIVDQPLHAQPDQMRDVVERLLAMFLSDPLAQPLPADQMANPVATPGSKSCLGLPDIGHTQASLFDLPSSKRPGTMRSQTDFYGYTGSPASRGRAIESEAAPT